MKKLFTIALLTSSIAISKEHAKAPPPNGGDHVTAQGAWTTYVGTDPNGKPCKVEFGPDLYRFHEADSWLLLAYPKVQHGNPECHWTQSNFGNGISSFRNAESDDSGHWFFTQCSVKSVSNPTHFDCVKGDNDSAAGDACKKLEKAVKDPTKHYNCNNLKKALANQ